MWKLLLPTQMPLDTIMATLHAKSWEIDFVLFPWCLPPVSETNYSPTTTPLFLTPLSVSECPTAGRTNPDRSLAPTTLHPHCQTIWTHRSIEPAPPLGLLLSCLGVRPPLLFPLWKTCSVWLFCGFIWWHRSHKEGDGERGASHWQGDGCHKWQRFVLVKYTEMLALQRQKAEAKGNNLFTCSVWLSKPWHCRNLLLFQVCCAVAQGACAVDISPHPPSPCSAENKHHSKYTRSVLLE